MRLITKGRSIFLAYDQGLEHGPTDFNDKNVDPEYILEIALKAKLNGVILQKGVAEKYYKKKYASVPLILKLNGKTNIVKGDPVSRQLCTVKEAKKLGAKAVGYTIYLGSIHEEEMFVEFEKIEREARKAKLPVIAWIYPRGKAVKNPQSREMQAYAARVGLELGADMIKMHVSTNFNDFRWAVKSAGKASAGGWRQKDNCQEIAGEHKGIPESRGFGHRHRKEHMAAQRPCKIGKSPEEDSI